MLSGQSFNYEKEVLLPKSGDDEAAQKKSERTASIALQNY